MTVALGKRRVSLRQERLQLLQLRVLGSKRIVRWVRECLKLLQLIRQCCNRLRVRSCCSNSLQLLLQRSTSREQLGSRPERPPTNAP